MNKINQVLLQQKEEKELLLGKSYTMRDKLNPVRQLLTNNLIKVILGPRRAGKSVLSLMLLKGSNFSYVNFDDELFASSQSFDEITKGMFEVYGNTNILFFDEIQNFDNWELFVNKLHRRGYNIVITGSNAKLLGSDLATKLTGRYLSIELLPFSFLEFLSTKNMSREEALSPLPEKQGRVLNYLREYLLNGGFPEVTVQQVDPKTYLDTLFDAIIFKDIIKKHNIRFPQKIYDLALYLISNFCSEYSFNRIKNNLGFKSVLTVQRYIHYLEEAYLFFSLNRFSFKFKEQLKAAKKMYIVDNGFVLAKSFQTLENTDRLMENLVLLELIRRGYKINQELFYYKAENNKEIDFVTKRGNVVDQLIQVSYDVRNPETKKRELTALTQCSSELKCSNLILITWDDEGIETHGNSKIQLIPLWKWLMEY